jgi:histidinol phosphatase-like enzyme
LKKTDVEISGNGEIGAPGMIFKAVSKWNIDLNKRLMIGEKKTDSISTKRSDLK